MLSSHFLNCLPSGYLIELLCCTVYKSLGVALPCEWSLSDFPLVWRYSPARCFPNMLLWQADMHEVHWLFHVACLGLTVIVLLVRRWTAVHLGVSPFELSSEKEIETCLCDTSVSVKYAGPDCSTLRQRGLSETLQLWQLLIYVRGSQNDLSGPFPIEKSEKEKDR